MSFCRNLFSIQISSISIQYKPLEFLLLYVMLYLGYFIVFTLTPFNEYHVVIPSKLFNQKLWLKFALFLSIFVSGNKTLIFLSKYVCVCSEEDNKGPSMEGDNSFTCTSTGKQFIFNISATFNSVITLTQTFFFSCCHNKPLKTYQIKTTTYYISV